MEHQVLGWITQYGYFAIFLLLVCGIVGLPVPDETLLTFTGFLVFKGNFLCRWRSPRRSAGSLSGITVSYTLGRTFGMKLIHRYGRYIHITEEHVNKAHAWFARVGHWGLTFGYFVPGFRHLSAYAAGMSAVEPPQFALFAYTGGCLWVAPFSAWDTFSGIAGRRSKRTSSVTSQAVWPSAWLSWLRRTFSGGFCGRAAAGAR
jgi:membrane protein DedA with SNARE-associated domain